MKKILVFFSIIIIIVAIVSMMWIKYQTKTNQAKKENEEFTFYENKTIYGAELVTIMNNAINKNTENNVQKDNKGNYINNNNNSIQIDIKFKDVDKTFNMETIYNGTMEKFVENYNNIQFVCSKIEYHKNTKLVKYLLFEQITQ